MQYKIIEEENVKSGYIEFPIEHDDRTTLISTEEIIVSNSLNINKYHIDDKIYITKEYEKIDSYKFKYNALYFYHNVDNVIGGIVLDIFTM